LLTRLLITRLATCPMAHEEAKLRYAQSEGGGAGGDGSPRSPSSRRPCRAQCRAQQRRGVESGGGVGSLYRQAGADVSDAQDDAGSPFRCGIAFKP
jgi:hypothetical protein